jgi:hypothetical protein
VNSLTPFPVPLLPGPLLNQAVRGKAVLHSRSQFVTLKRGQNIKPRPYVFTEHGAVMLANVLRSPLAVRASIQVVANRVATAADTPKIPGDGPFRDDEAWRNVAFTGGTSES